LKTNNEY